MQMFTSSGLAVVAAVIVCVCDVPSTSGQLVSLSSVSHGSAPFKVYYAIGQSTAQIGRTYFPVCNVQFLAGPYIRLVNTRNNVIVGQRGPFNNTGDLGTSTALWDFTSHPVLTAELGGLYRCMTADSQSSDTYELIIVAAPTITSPAMAVPNPVLYDSNGTISCTGSGVLPITVTWTTQMTLPGAMFTTSNSSSTTAQGGQQIISSVMFTANLTVAPPLATNFLATCQVQLVDDFSCSIAMTPSITTQCNATRTAIASNTTTVTVVRKCEDLDRAEFILSASYSPVPGPPEPISCHQGFTQNGTNINHVTCLPSGRWNPLPPDCVDMDECSLGSNCTDMNADCTNTMGSFTCECKDGYTGTGLTMGSCTAVKCPGLTDTSIVPIPESTYNTTRSVNCSTGYHMPTTPSVTCQADMDWTAKPRCTSNPEFCDQLNGTTFIRIGKTRRNETATVVCAVGYETPQPMRVTCLSDRTWSATPSCSPEGTGDEVESFAVGAIIGIVIGALAAIGLITVIVIYFVYYKNKFPPYGKGSIAPEDEEMKDVKDIESS